MLATVVSSATAVSVVIEVSVVTVVVVVTVVTMVTLVVTELLAMMMFRWGCSEVDLAGYKHASMGAAKSLAGEMAIYLYTASALLY